VASRGAVVAGAAEAAAASANADATPRAILRVRPTLRDPDGMVTDEDVTLIIQALFDIRRDLARIVQILEGDDEPEGSEEEDS
jgi:hypothetical protein